MSKQPFFLLPFALFFLVACAPTGPTTPTSALLPTTTPAPTSTKSVATFTSVATTPQHYPTYTPRPTQIPKPTRTPVQIPVSTFVPANAITRTPSPAAQCPQPKAATKEIQELVDLLALKQVPNNYEALTHDKLLAVLNTSGVSGLNEAFSKVVLPNANGDHWLASYSLTMGDLTNDGVDEVIVIGNSTGVFVGSFKVFACRVGKYEFLFEDISDGAGLTIDRIDDLNLDGVNELVLNGYSLSSGLVLIYEWDGSTFQSLIRRWRITEYNQLDFNDAAYLTGRSKSDIKDSDNNGTYELILIGGSPGYLGGLSGGDGPWREETNVYMWDGQYFTLHSQQYFSPQFRFQAVQDGDLATEYHDYEQALLMYQAAIFSDTLRSWDLVEWQKLANDVISQEIIDIYTIIAGMPSAINQTEYDQLSAYARYRIMLLHLLRDYESDAKTVYDTLQAKYPAGNAGHPYAEMATEFWNEYQLSHDIGKACAPAIRYATQHEEILDPLGGSSHGMFNEYYQPADICPFETKP